MPKPDNEKKLKYYNPETNNNSTERNIQKIMRFVYLISIVAPQVINYFTEPQIYELFSSHDVGNLITVIATIALASSIISGIRHIEGKKLDHRENNPGRYKGPR